MNFDEAAREWDNKRRVGRGAIIANTIKAALSLRKNQSAMEFGCGTGIISFDLYKEFEHITLIDTSEEMIKEVDRKVKALQLENIKTYCCDIMEDAPNKKYDIIYSSMVLHHIEDISKLCKKFNSMLNPEGKLCIVDLDEEDGTFHKNEAGFKGHNGFSQEWMKNILESNGFCDIKSYIFYEGTKEIDHKEIQYSLFIMTGNKSK